MGCWQFQFAGTVCLATLACLAIFASVGCEPAPPKGVMSKSANGSAPSESKPARKLQTSIAVERIEDDLRDVVYENGAKLGHFTLPEPLGGGTAIVDFDCDGVLDVIGSGGGTVAAQERKLLGCDGAIWRGLEPFRHTNVSQKAHVDFASAYNHGILAADYDADGFVDFLVTGYEAMLLFRNQGDGTFEETAESAKLDNCHWSCGAAFFDADNDGDLDLYISRYANWSFDNNPTCYSRFDASQREYCGLRHLEGMDDSLYENLGNGSFRDVSHLVHVDVPSRGLGVMAADLDGDRLVDLYVANDVQANFLFRNNGSWSFTEMGVRSGVAVGHEGWPEGSMGIALGDYNMDGRFDLWVTNYDNDINALYRNDGHLSFTYASHSAQIASTDDLTVGWGTFFNDLDLDGDEDLVVANGHLERLAPGSLPQRAHILENIDGKLFRRWSNLESPFSIPQSGRGLASADFDRDGLVDFVISRIGDTHALVRNVSQRQGTFVEIQLIGTVSNRDAVGATLRLQVGDRAFVRQVYGGGSYASTRDREIHFGIPSRLGDQGVLSIAWPSGLDQSITLPSFNRRMTVVEGL